jgi:drug/metabolite transporter (DMT)-like permease
MRRYLTGRGTSPIALAAAQISVGALILVIAAPALATEPVDPQLDVVASVLALGALGTGFAYLLNYQLIDGEGATTASTVTYLLPILAVVLGAIVLAEAITWNLFVGTSIVLAAVALSDRRIGARERRNASPPTRHSPRVDPPSR